MRIIEWTAAVPVFIVVCEWASVWSILCFIQDRPLFWDGELSIPHEKWVAGVLCTLHVTDRCSEAGSHVESESEPVAKAHCALFKADCCPDWVTEVLFPLYIAGRHSWPELFVLCTWQTTALRQGAAYIIWMSEWLELFCALYMADCCSGVRGMWTLSRHELITGVLKVHHL